MATLKWYRRVQVLGYEYGVQMDRTREDMQSLGRRDSDLLIIRIAKDMPQALQISTLIHEVIEAANYHLELNIDHRAICALEAVMYLFLTAAGVDLRPLLETKDGG